MSNWGQVLQVQVPREIGHKSASITTKVFEAVCSVEKERRVKNKETAKFEKIKSAKIFKPMIIFLLFTMGQRFFNLPNFKLMKAVYPLWALFLTD